MKNKAYALTIYKNVLANINNEKLTAFINHMTE